MHRWIRNLISIFLGLAAFSATAPAADHFVAIQRPEHYSRKSHHWIKPKQEVTKIKKVSLISGPKAILEIRTSKRRTLLLRFPRAEQGEFLKSVLEGKKPYKLLIAADALVRVKGKHAFLV